MRVTKYRRRLPEREPMLADVRAFFIGVPIKIKTQAITSLR